MNSLELFLQSEQFSLAPAWNFPSWACLLLSVQIIISTTVLPMSKINYLKKYFPESWGRRGTRTNKPGNRFLVPNDIYCFPVDHVSWTLSLKLFFFSDSLIFFPPDSFLLLPWGFWGLCSRTQSSCSSASIAQNAGKLYVKLYFELLIPTVQSTSFPKGKLPPNCICSEQWVATVPAQPSSSPGYHTTEVRVTNLW